MPKIQYGQPGLEQSQVLRCSKKNKEGGREERKRKEVMVKGRRRKKSRRERGKGNIIMH